MRKIYTATFVVSIAISALAISTFTTDAKDFKYYKTVTLKVGQSIVLKGVRHNNCGDKAPSWIFLAGRLPFSRTGNFSNGGVGTMNSNKCGANVGARGIKFTAKKSGVEKLKIFGDKVKITVK